MEKAYKVEVDVLASAGEEGLARIAQDNRVYIDFEKLAREARSKGSEDYYELRRVFEWTNDIMDQTSEEYLAKKEMVLPAGGIISWEKEPEGTEYITRCPIKESELKRSGKKVSFPAFLEYTTRPLNSGLIHITHDSPNNLKVEDVLETTGLDSLYGQQHVIVNNQIVYKVHQEIKEHGSNGRYLASDKVSLKKIRRDLAIKSDISSLETRNLEQMLAWEQLTSEDVEISFLTGGSGSGKSVLAYAAAVEQILGTEKKQGIME